MGFISELFSGKEKSKFTFIKDIAAIICGGDTDVLNAIDKMLSGPEKYFTQNADRYDDRGIDIQEIQDIIEEDDKEELVQLLWLGMVDELIEGGYAAEVDYKCTKDELLYSLSQLKAYPMLEEVFKGFMLSDTADGVQPLCREISKRAAGAAVIGCIDIDSDSYPLFILPSLSEMDSSEMFSGICSLARNNGFTISEP